MPQRVAAFLRGVNVGGNKKVDMATLRRVLENAGLTDVRTILQSGNAVFTHDGSSVRTLAGRIEDAMGSEFGFSPTVLLRTLPELERAVAADPLADTATDPARHLIGFMPGAASKRAAAAAAGKSAGEDLVQVVGSHLYMWCPNGISRSPLFKVDFERILGMPVTMRNANTVRKVAELLRS